MQKLIEMKNKKGFTLIEMLIVILIIVILLAIAVPAVAAYRRDALRTQDEGAVETILTSLEAALIREDLHINTTTAGWESHRSPHLDYDTLVNYTDATNPETEDFYHLLAEYLGPNFQGNFYFRWVEARNEISYIFYWRTDSATAQDSVMIYNAEDQRTHEPLYCSEAADAGYGVTHWINASPDGFPWA